jgi:nitric oxide synthase oxygenase domain/subunit
MWKDRAIVEVTAAVMHSFREAGMGEEQLACRGTEGSTAADGCNA